jgi:hypothetical protein
MNISELISRPTIYAFEDGAQELGIGLLSVVTAGAFLAAARLPPGYVFAAQAIWVASSLGMAWGIRKLKERVTSPRGGYVALDDQHKMFQGKVSRRAINAAVILAVGLFMAFAPIDWTRPGSQAVAATALYFGMYMFVAARWRLPSMLFLAGFSLLLGVWAYTAKGGFAFILLWQGVAIAISGVIRLWRFLKTHPQPLETET